MNLLHWLPFILLVTHFPLFLFQMTSLVDLILRTILAGNKLSNGSSMLLNENLYSNFFTTYWSAVVCSMLCTFTHQIVDMFPRLLESPGIFIGKFPYLESPGKWPWSWKVLAIYLQGPGKSWNLPGSDADGSFWLQIDMFLLTKIAIIVATRYVFWAAG